MYALIGASVGKEVVQLPVKCKGGMTIIVEGKLLCALICARFPDDCRFIDAGRMDVVAVLVPLERKKGYFVLAQSVR